jgi:hypothetical protein
VDKTFALDLSCGPLFMRDKQTRIAPDQVNKDRVQVRRLASHLTPFDPNTFLFMLRVHRQLQDNSGRLSAIAGVDRWAWARSRRADQAETPSAYLIKHHSLGGTGVDFAQCTRRASFATPGSEPTKRSSTFRSDAGWHSTPRRGACGWCAGISDDMFLPEDISRRLDEMKGQ